jgi:hypothetical protein
LIGCKRVYQISLRNFWLETSRLFISRQGSQVNKLRIFLYFAGRAYQYIYLNINQLDALNKMREINSLKKFGASSWLILR